VEGRVEKAYCSTVRVVVVLIGPLDSQFWQVQLRCLAFRSREVRAGASQVELGLTIHCHGFL
jgi:hypothetical protein